MKKLMITLLVAGMLMTFGMSSKASANDYLSEMTGGDNYAAFNGGHNTVSMELGWLISEETNQIFAVGLYHINNGKAVHSAKGHTQNAKWTDDPCDPHDFDMFAADKSNGHLTNGGKTLDDEFGVFVKYGLEVMPDSGFYITALLGLAHAKETQLWITDNRAFDYIKETSDFEILYGAGVMWIINDSTVLQVDYDNRREWTVGIGFVY